MRAVVQVVDNATLTSVDGYEAKIGKGLMVLLGVSAEDTENDAKYIADKLSKLRIFNDENDKLNLSVSDINGEILLVSNFTLYGSAKGTNRPDFAKSAKADKARPLYELVAKLLQEKVPTKTGLFGEHMEIDMKACGPITIIVES